MDTPRRDSPGPRWLVPAGLAATVGVLAGAATPAGGVVVTEIQRLLDFYSGVFTLVALTTSVVAGLVATDRVILAIQHRILAQALHRAATLIASAFLVAHVVMEILTRNADVIQTLLPVGRTTTIALGTVAAHLMILVALTGLIRGRFAVGRRPGVWRAMHGLAYVSWLTAILHGLLAGRHPAIWVTWSYAICVAGVAVALLARGLVIVHPRNAEADSSQPREADRRDRSDWADQARRAGADARVPDQRIKVPR